jgi:hypothetical protein
MGYDATVTVALTISLVVVGLVYTAWVLRAFVTALHAAGEALAPSPVRRLPTSSMRITAVVRDVDEHARVLVLTRADGARHNGLVFTLEGAPQAVEDAATLLQRWRDDDASVLLVASRSLPAR